MIFTLSGETLSVGEAAEAVSGRAQISSTAANVRLIIILQSFMFCSPFFAACRGHCIFLCKARDRCRLLCSILRRAEPMFFRVLFLTSVDSDPERIAHPCGFAGGFSRLHARDSWSAWPALSRSRCAAPALSRQRSVAYWGIIDSEYYSNSYYIMLICHWQPESSMIHPFSNCNTRPYFC